MQASTSHGFERFATGRQIVIDDPAAADASGAGTIPEGISFDGSAIVGNYAAPEGAPEGFILRGGTFTTYDVPKAAVTVVAFDNYGTFGLVGYYTYTAGNAERAGHTYGFIATPSK